MTVACFAGSRRFCETGCTCYLTPYRHVYVAINSADWGFLAKPQTVRHAKHLKMERNLLACEKCPTLFVATEF